MVGYNGGTAGKENGDEMETAGFSTIRVPFWGFD